jgi:hypothetical protein
MLYIFCSWNENTVRETINIKFLEIRALPLFMSHFIYYLHNMYIVRAYYKVPRSIWISGHTHHEYLNRDRPCELRIWHSLVDILWPSGADPREPPYVVLVHSKIYW